MGFRAGPFQSSSSPRSAPFSRRTALLLLAIYVLLSLVTLLRHEMWRDELQAWLLAKEQPSFAELARAVRYEKHPLAWYILLLLLSRLTDSPLVMQLLHLTLASASAWLIVRFSPFSPVQKTLLVFGYYLFFEYSIISRNYALGLLSLFLFCFFYTRLKEAPLAWGGCLFVLANTSIFGLILAGAAGGAVMADLLKGKSFSKKGLTFLALIIATTGGLLSFWFLRPLPEGSWDQASRLHTSFNLGLSLRVLSTLSRAYLQVPRPTFQFWNTHLFGQGPMGQALCVALTFLLLGYAGYLLWKRRSALVFFALSTGGILALLYVWTTGFVRHQGHLFIGLVASLWLARAQESQAPPSPLDTSRKLFRPKAASLLLTLILGVQTGSGLFAAALDIAYPFSQAKTVASYIKRNAYLDLPIVGEMDYLMTPVSGYLNRKIYFVRGHRSGSYIKWDMARFMEVSPELILKEAEEISRREKKDCLLLLNFHLDPALERPGYLTKLMATGPAIVGSEVYRLYLLEHAGLLPPAQKSPDAPAPPP